VPDRPRVLAIGLDGYAAQLGARFAAEGLLPALTRLRAESAAYDLEHGPAQRTGLAFEHIATGLAPAASGRQAAVSFDPRSFAVWQEGTSRAPFPAALGARTVVFNTPYFWLERAPAVQGIVGWGAHDPGVAGQARPAGLATEIEDRFGPYPAREFLYATPWASPARSARMGEALAAAATLRARAAQWCLAERCPDWDLALVVVSELHSAHEGLWHGVDAEHPLHALPSAAPAAAGLRAVYRAVDGLVGALAARFPDATLVVFATGGMGPNHSDLASMALLPELLYRHAFRKPLLTVRPEWAASPDGIVPLREGEDWSAAVNAGLPKPAPVHPWRRWVGPGDGLAARASSGARPLPLEWMPAARYRPYWPRMPVFALPSFYDGRVRVNLAGRERHGRVPAARYEDTLRELQALLDACRDPYTGSGVIAAYERQAPADPRQAGPSLADLVVVWSHGVTALEHPQHGRIGPLPWRRTGGHTGTHGMALVRAPGVAPGPRGVRSTFDVVPTLIGLLGEAVPAGLSGRSLLAAA
jgi:predicted AlkP superfamily phosphohydrolase/phosphomutase